MKKQLIAIAKSRIKRLFDFAKAYVETDPEAAEEAIDIARRIAQRVRIRLPKEYKILFCRRCGNFFLKPRSFTVRVRPRRSTHVVVRCNRCGWTRRYYAFKKSYKES